MDWGRGSPGGAVPWSGPAGTGVPRARPQSLLEGRRLRVTTAQIGASEKFFWYDKRLGKQNKVSWMSLEKVDD